MTEQAVSETEQGTATLVGTDTSMTDPIMTDPDTDSGPEELDPQDVFDEWIVGVKKSDRKMLATCLFMSFQMRQRMNIMEYAATQLSSIHLTAYGNPVVTSSGV